MEEVKNFVVCGINHNELSLLEREEFVLEFKPYKKLKSYFETKVIDDALLLSTCLRNEFYFWNAKEEVINEFSKIKGSFVKQGREALVHLYKVVCGFDSKIPGEEQILSQIKKAYLMKIEEQNTKSPLNTIFNRSISLGKKFRNISKINENSLSIENLGIKSCDMYFDNIIDKSILIIGAGEIATATYKILKKRNCKDIKVIKRRKSLIEDDIKYYSFQEKIDLFYESDIIFGTTTAPHDIYSSGELDIERVEERKRIMIDFAVPRDFDNKLGSFRGQKLVNLDELDELASSSYDKRLDICNEYEFLINETIDKTLEWFRRGD